MEAFITNSDSLSKAHLPADQTGVDFDTVDPSGQLRQSQARLLNDGSRLAAILTLLAAPLLAYLLKDSVPAANLIIWTGVISVISVVRFIMFTRYHRPLGMRNLHHLKLSLLSWNCLSGLAWGSTALLIYPVDALPQQVLLLVAMAGVVAIAITVHSGMLAAVLAFTLPATMPIIIRLISENTLIHDQLAMLASLFLTFALVISAKLHRLTLRGIQVGVDNTNLIDHLEQRKRETDKLNAELRREVTVRRNAEIRLRQERDFISGILDTESAIVIVLDRDARILRFNRACETATGFYVHEVVGKTLWEALLPENQVERFREHFNAVVNGFFPNECEIQWRSKDSGIRLVQLSNTAILGSDGKCTHVVSTGVDVTERRHTEAALARTQENFELLVEGVTDYAIYMLKRDGTIISWNTGAERISGYSAEEVIGAHYGEFFSPCDQVIGHPQVELRIAASDGHYKRAGWHQKRDGSRFWATVTIHSVRDTENELRGFSMIINDISARILAQQALEESEARISAMTANIPGMVYQYLDGDSPDSGFIYVSKGAKEVVGLEAQTILDKKVELSSLIQEDDRDDFERSRLQARETLSTWHWEGRMFSPEDGSLHWIDLRSSPRRQEDGQVLWDGIIFDITLRKQAEFALARSRELLRALSVHLQNVREEEKAGLARELHDELGSMLTTLKIEVSSLKNQLAHNPEGVHAHIDDIVETVHEAIATTRRISTNLRPPILDNLGLLPAIEWQLEQFKQRTGMNIDLHVTGDSTILGDNHTIAIFRILQEGLTNIARHAEATRVSVAVSVNSQSIGLDIIDDGKGFTVDEHKPGTSYGLYSMQERAGALGGSVEVISQPGEGTRLKLRVPVTTQGTRSYGVNR